MYRDCFSRAHIYGVLFLSLSPSHPLYFVNYHLAKRNHFRITWWTNWRLENTFTCPLSEDGRNNTEVHVEVTFIPILQKPKWDGMLLTILANLLPALAFSSCPAVSSCRLARCANGTGLITDGHWDGTVPHWGNLSTQTAGCLLNPPPMQANSGQGVMLFIRCQRVEFLCKLNTGLASQKQANKNCMKFGVGWGGWQMSPCWLGLCSTKEKAEPRKALSTS